MLVNFNGDLFKCTARDFSNTAPLGKLLPDGTAVWNEGVAELQICKIRVYKYLKINRYILASIVIFEVLQHPL